MLCTNAARNNIGLEPLVAYFKASRTVCSCVQPRTELLRNFINNLVCLILVPRPRPCSPLVHQSPKPINSCRASVRRTRVLPELNL